MDSSSIWIHTYTYLNERAGQGDWETWYRSEKTPPWKALVFHFSSVFPAYPSIWIPHLSSPGIACNTNTLRVQRSPGNREIRAHNIIVSREGFEETKHELGPQETAEICGWKEWENSPDKQRASQTRSILRDGWSLPPPFHADLSRLLLVRFLSFRETD